MKYQTPSQIDLQYHGYAYISARPVDASTAPRLSLCSLKISAGWY